MVAAIATQGLTRAFGQVMALDHLSLEVPQGIIFGFLGPNGAGKTTTIRLLLGLLEPTAGSAEVLGFDVRHGQPIRERVGVVLEQPGLYSRLSAYDNLTFFAGAYHVPRGERRARIEELLRHVGLWERRTDLVETYSKGMRQKLAFARALLHRPALVFMDEPTAGLDIQSAVALREDILALVREAGTTVFLTTHNLAEVEKVCNQVAVISKGRLIAADTPVRLRAGTQESRVRILCHEISPQDIDTLRQLPQVASITQNHQTLEVVLRSGEKVAPLIRALSEQGVEIEEVVPVMASLEQAFLTMLREAEEEGKD